MTDQRVMFVFPGQGSQYRGMGSDLYQEFAVAREVYDRANDVLGFDLRQLSFEDPAGELGLTRNTQPALLTHHIACLRVFEQLTAGRLQPALAAGHSLGEYSALVAAGALGFDDALRLVRRRGELMGEYGEGGMLALTLDVDTARPLADRHYCQVASCNLPDQTVVGGRDSDLDALAADLAERMPRKRAIRLATEGAFHTYFMVTAAQLFRADLDRAAFSAPGVGVLSNYTGGLHDLEPQAIRTRLFFQLFNPVNWVGCLNTALAGEVTTFIEFGGGLGAEDGPAAKRPNLESIIRKTLKAGGVEAQHVAAINCATLHAAAATFGS
ncbi:MAG: ACP S-malonyltransferase [Chromatiales bacterium]|jgi:[acyl-carrier-protein] S-malonyltransferase|nr:MAG: ACP S-malonyltransferase [Chromatiales bacterium]